MSGLAALACLDIAALYVYFRESREIERLVPTLTRRDRAASEQIRDLTNFLAKLPDTTQDAYFLLPIFRPLRPTALQVIHTGGDCAYRARAFIVMIRHLGVEASKIALYDRKGEPAHAIAVVQTERGPYVVDLLFGMIYEAPDGGPIRLADLSRNEALVRSEIAEEASEGNELAKRYPFDRYPLSDPRTINWHKNGATSITYRALSAIFGRGRIDSLPRFYIAEEPAFMVLIASFMGKACLLCAFFFLGRWNRPASEKRTAAAILVP